MFIKRAQLVEEWGSFLAEFDWQVFTTLTFRFPVSKLRPKSYFDQYIRKLEQFEMAEVGWFLVQEVSHSRTLHLHALLLSQCKLHTRACGKAWMSGHAHAVQYNPQLGATYYCSKTIGTQDVEYFFSDPVLLNLARK